MVHIAPNLSVLTAVILEWDDYELQDTYFRLRLKVIEHDPIEGHIQMAGAEPGSEIEIILLKELIGDLQPGRGMEFRAEVQKISRNLWRVMKMLED